MLRVDCTKHTKYANETLLLGSSTMGYKQHGVVIQVLGIFMIQYRTLSKCRHRI